MSIRFFSSLIQLIFLRNIGIGIALVYASTMLILNQYFVQKMATAMSALTVAGGLGIIVYGYIQTFLVDMFGLQGSFLIHAGVFLHTCICGQLFFPNEDIPRKNTYITQEKSIKIDISIKDGFNTATIKNYNSINEFNGKITNTGRQFAIGMYMYMYMMYSVTQCKSSHKRFMLIRLFKTLYIYILKG